jgi:hypothetical protein
MANRHDAEDLAGLLEKTSQRLLPLVVG